MRGRCLVGECDGRRQSQGNPCSSPEVDLFTEDRDGEQDRESGTVTRGNMPVRGRTTAVSPPLESDCSSINLPVWPQRPVAKADAQPGARCLPCFRFLERIITRPKGSTPNVEMTRIVASEATWVAALLTMPQTPQMRILSCRGC